MSSLAIALLALTLNAPAQRGRAFVSIEAHIGTATGVYVGHVRGLERIEHEKPKDGFYPGDPYKVAFEVDETIKGPAAKNLELILTIQHAFKLEYLRDNKTEVMLVATNQYIDEEAEIGLEPLGRRYSFRILKPIVHPKGQPNTKWIGDQFNISLNSGRMFDINLHVITRRDEILKRARTFAKKHPEVLEAHHIIVPNEFGVKCGYTNAYCGITLPLCPETHSLLLSLRKDSSRLIKDVKASDRGSRQASISREIEFFLSKFKLDN